MVSIIIVLLGNFHNCYYFHTVHGVLHYWEIMEDREACFATVHGVAKSQTQLSDGITTAINLKRSWHFGISISFMNLRNLFTGTPDTSTWDNTYVQECRNLPDDYFIFTDPRIGNLHSKNVKEHIANYSFPSTQVAHWLRIHLPSRRCRLDPWVRKIPWRRKWQPFPVFLPGKSHGQRSLVSSSLWGHKKNRTWLVTKQQVDSVIKAPSPLLLSPGWCHHLVNGTIR